MVVVLSFILKRFAMKKWILSAAFICCINGWAAAQKITSKAQPKAEQKTPQKGKEAQAVPTKKSGDKIVAQQNVTLAIPKPDLDTLRIPVVKNEQ
jgi:hypothetical protein